MINAQQVQAIPVAGLQAPTIGLQAAALPATTATQIDLTAIMNLMLVMVIMVMMMKMVGKVGEAA